MLIFWDIYANKTLNKFVLNSKVWSVNYVCFTGPIPKIFCLKSKVGLKTNYRFRVTNRFNTFWRYPQIYPLFPCIRSCSLKIIYMAFLIFYDLISNSRNFWTVGSILANDPSFFCSWKTLSDRSIQQAISYYLNIDFKVWALSLTLSNLGIALK